MNVCLIADQFTVESGTGLARYSQELLKGLKNVGINVELIHIEHSNKPFAGLLTHFVRLPYYVVKNIPDFDLFHGADPVSALAFVFVKKPTIVTYHDLFPLLYNEAKAKVLDSLIFKIGKYSHRIIAVSTQTKDEIVTRLKIPEEKITVVNLGIDEKFKPTKKEERDYYIIGYIGAMIFRKRIDCLIKAFYYFKKKYPKLKVRLVIIGKKKFEYPKLIELVRRLGITEYVEFKGPVPEEKLVETYNSFDVFVLPSEWEGFGLPILEAQRCGVPVVIRENARIPQEVSRYCVKAKSVEDMADKMYELLVNSTLRKEIIECGLNYSKNFTWDRTVKQTVEVYKEALETYTANKIG